MSSLVAYGGSSDSEEEEEIASVGVKTSKEQDVRKLLSVLPAPKKGKNQPVRLGIPSLQSRRVS